MQFHNFKEFNLELSQFNDPIFDTGKCIFVSKIVNKDSENINLKSSNLRILDCKNNNLEMEFLYSSGEFYEFLNNYDVIAKNEIIKNGETWFGNGLNVDTINNIFKGSIQLPFKIPNFPIVNFIMDNNCKIIGKRRKKLNSTDLKPNMEIELCFTIDGIHFHKNKCYLVYIVHQIKLINDNCQTTNSYFFEDNNEGLNIDEFNNES